MVIVSYVTIVINILIRQNCFVFGLSLVHTKSTILLSTLSANIAKDSIKYRK